MSMTTPYYNFDFEYYFDNFDFGAFAEEASYILAIVFVVIAAVFLVCFLANYIMESIAFYAMAKRRDINKAWLAWIPFARTWIKGAVADNYDSRTAGTDRHFRLFLLIGLVVYVLLIVSSLGSAFSIIPMLDEIESGNPESIIESVITLVFGVYSKIYSASYVYILYLAMHTIVMYKVYESVTAKLPLLFLLLSLIIPFFLSISLLCLRKKAYPEAPAEEKPLPAIPDAVQIGWYDQN